MEPEDKTMDYSEYDDNSENPENNLDDPDSENPDLSENNSENTVVRTNFIMPDRGKVKCRRVLCNA